jgi:hypothetical protein
VIKRERERKRERGERYRIQRKIVRVIKPANN